MGCWLNSHRALRNDSDFGAGKTLYTVVVWFYALQESHYSTAQPEIKGIVTIRLKANPLCDGHSGKDGNHGGKE
ncbi:MAG: hypothetical protein ACXWWD_12060 [Chitinophagaceae bacterium]